MRAFSEFYEKGRNLIPKSHRYAKGRDLIQGKRDIAERIIVDDNALHLVTN
ncbi:hypothetical protein C5167_000782 [Papaver somniferum]|uniref:Uncharacterized protein n=1 Tax=Papaver somniferum TaxID=3469 RepID=A0A4Y7KX72_PAPSO|nr:hypothetical protein C5167_000782 [Papaver somniferum]